MKILLGNNTLSLLAGSETWTYTLAMKLKAIGHHVACYSPELGIISKKLEDAGIHSYSSLTTHGIPQFTPVLQENIVHEYDVIIANHWHIVMELRKQFPKTPIISTVHGIIHEDDQGNWAPEHPALEGGVNQFVAVSEEVQDILRQKYSIDSILIRNFIDLKKFGSLPAPKVKPEQFLLNTNYEGREEPSAKLIRETAKLMGVKVTAIGFNFAATFETEVAVRDADVVFGMGRSVLEGMAAGRLGVVLGRWGFGGIVKESNVEEIRKFNFSGRNAGTTDLPTPAELAHDIEEAYQLRILDWTKQYVATEHNVVFAAQKFMRLVNELTGQTINTAVPTGAPPGAIKLKKAYVD